MPKAGPSPGRRVESGVEGRLSRLPERISSQHGQLTALFEKIDAALAQGAMRAARTAYTRFCDALDAHLALEEQIFFPAIHGLRPELGTTLAELVRKHDVIREAVESLYESLALSDPVQAQERLAEVASLISGHEVFEEELLDRAVHGTPFGAATDD